MVASYRLVFFTTLLTLLLTSSLPTSSGLWLPHMLSNNMILPRAPRTAKLWGTAAPDSTVSVLLGKDGPYQALADPFTGEWVLSLPPLPLSIEPVSVVITGDDTSVTLTNVKVGDVFLCGGQSNMQMAVAGCANSNVETAAAANYPHMSFASVNLNSSSTPLDDVYSMYWPPTTGWVPTAPNTVNSSDFWYFSALCYGAGRRVYDALGGTVPIGLVSSSFGGASAEAWSSLDAVAECGPYRLPNYNPNGANNASQLYNAMLYPLRHLQPTAILWYQGETNSENPPRYYCSFPALINDWRALFSIFDLPFYFVLLAGFGSGGNGWAIARDAQVSALSVPYTGAISAIDTTDAGDIYDAHPKNKTVLATRMAALVGVGVYGMAAPIQGPRFVSAQALYNADIGALTVSVTMDVGDAPPTSSLVALGTPGCTACCQLGVTTTRPLFRYLRTNATSGAVISSAFDTWALAGTQATLQSKLPTTDRTWLSTGSLTVQFEFSDFVECVVYNQFLTPANPWQVSLPLVVQQGASTMVPGPTGGMLTSLTGSATGSVTAASSAARVSLSSSSSSTGGGGGVTPPDNGGGGGGSSSSSGALTAMVIVFFILSLICTLLFAWQYRLRHGSLCCKGGDEGGRVGAQGVSDWWTNTMGVGKSLQWKRGMSDDEVLRAVASDRYD